MRFYVFKLRGILAGIAAILIFVVCAISFINVDILAMGKPIKRLPIYCVDRPDNKIALTFDAAWGADKTEQILALLKEYEQQGTFFVVAFWAEKNADKLKTLDEAGIEIGSHSNTHAHMNKLNAAQIDLELTASVESIKRVTGKTASIFRCPFGEYSDKVLDGAQRNGLKVIQWDVDSHDWMNLTARQIAERVLNRVKSGSIVLMHNDAQNIVEGLRLILEGLKVKGLESVRVSDLIYSDNYEIDHTGRQISIKNL